MTFERWHFQGLGHIDEQIGSHARSRKNVFSLNSIRGELFVPASSIFFFYLLENQSNISYAIYVITYLLPKCSIIIHTSNGSNIKLKGIHILDYCFMAIFIFFVSSIINICNMIFYLLLLISK